MDFMTLFKLGLHPRRSHLQFLGILFSLIRFFFFFFFFFTFVWSPLPSHTCSHLDSNHQKNRKHSDVSGLRSRRIPSHPLSEP